MLFLCFAAQQEKDANSCKSKASLPGQETLSALDLLSEDFKQQCAETGRSLQDLIVLPTPRKKQDAAGSKQQRKGSSPQPPAKQPSKSELRKLRQVQHKQERRQNLSQVSCESGYELALMLV